MEIRLLSGEALKAPFPRKILELPKLPNYSHNDELGANSLPVFLKNPEIFHSTNFNFHELHQQHPIDQLPNKFLSKGTSLPPPTTFYLQNNRKTQLVISKSEN